MRLFVCLSLSAKKPASANFLITKAVLKIVAVQKLMGKHTKNTHTLTHTHTDTHQRKKGEGGGGGGEKKKTEIVFSMKE